MPEALGMALGSAVRRLSAAYFSAPVSMMASVCLLFFVCPSLWLSACAPPPLDQSRARRAIRENSQRIRVAQASAALDALRTLALRVRDAACGRVLFSSELSLFRGTEDTLVRV